MDWQQGILGASIVVGAAQWIKSLDTEKKWKKYYRLLPLLLSLLPAFLLAHISEAFTWSEILLTWLQVFSISVLGYESIIEVIDKKLKS